MKLTRRQMLGVSALAGTSLLLGGGRSLVAQENTSSIEKVELDISIPNLPKGFEGYRIGFISDLHIGPCSSTELMEEALVILKKSAPDMVLLGGDFILMPDSRLDQSLHSLCGPKACFEPGRNYEQDLSFAEEAYSAMGNILKGLKVPDGVLGVYGNHDKWVSPELCRRRLSEGGVNFLVNESVTLSRGPDSIEVFGSDDFWAGLPELPHWEGESGDRRARLFLTHNPDLLSEALKRGCRFEFGFAGHTHGGQIKLPLLGALHYNVQDRGLAEGLCRRGDCQIYTSRGIGTVGIPLRLNCPPEVSIFRLKRA